MARTASYVRLSGLAGTVATLGLLAGCASECSSCRGCKKELPPEVTPQPLGTFAHGWQEAQASKAEASDFAFYLDEWYMGGKYLGPSGVNHLRQVIRRMPSEPYPLVIEPHVDETLNAARRKFIVDALVSNGIVAAEAERRVIIEVPIAEGLRGDEAERIYYKMINPYQYGTPNNQLNGFNRTGFGGLGAYGGFGGGYGGFGGGFGGFGGGYGGFGGW